MRGTPVKSSRIQWKKIAMSLGKCTACLLSESPGGDLEQSYTWNPFTSLHFQLCPFLNSVAFTQNKRKLPLFLVANKETRILVFWGPSSKIPKKLAFGVFWIAYIYIYIESNLKGLESMFFWDAFARFVSGCCNHSRCNELQWMNIFLDETSCDGWICCDCIGTWMLWKWMGWTCIDGNYPYM